jgi:hypothetical protein
MEIEILSYNSPHSANVALGLLTNDCLKASMFSDHHTCTHNAWWSLFPSGSTRSEVFVPITVQCCGKELFSDEQNSLRFNSHHLQKKKKTLQTINARSYALHYTMTTETASVRPANGVVPAISSSGVANMTHFINSQVLWPHLYITENIVLQ